MNYLPLFADLRQRLVLVVGGEVATRKIALQQRAGSEIKIVAQTLAEPLVAALNMISR